MRLPERWAEGSLPPVAFELPEGWAKIDERYRGMVTSPRPPISGAPLDAVFDVARRNGATRAYLEREYIDADFRDEFANFYAQTFRNIPDRCERLHFFDGTRYLGFIVMRPVLGQPVCRTLLQPPADLEPHVSCATAMVVWLVVNAVWQPFEPYPLMMITGLARASPRWRPCRDPLILLAQGRAARRDRARDREAFRVAVRTDPDLHRLQRRLDEIAERPESEPG